VFGINRRLHHEFVLGRIPARVEITSSGEVIFDDCFIQDTSLSHIIPQCNVTPRQEMSLINQPNSENSNPFISQKSLPRTAIHIDRVIIPMLAYSIWHNQAFTDNSPSKWRCERETIHSSRRESLKMIHFIVSTNSLSNC
jgi:hypothetical protein